jgi:hypothetical protein
MKSLLRFSFVFLVIACGCSEDTEIRTYSVARKATPVLPSAEPQPTQTLAVILPSKDAAWTLKLMDDPSKVAPLVADFRQIASSLEFDDQGKPRWKLAPGWSEQVLEGQFTYAKFSHEAGATVTLSQIVANTAESSKWQSDMIENINRWRGQLGLSNQGWQAMQPDLEEVPELSTETAKAYFVSLEGMRKPGGSGMGSGAPFLDRMREQQTQSQGQTQAGQATTQQTQPGGKSPLKYQVPEGWKEVPSSSGIRLATFEVKDQDKLATVTISSAGGELESNIQMWFQQVGVEPDPQRVQDAVKAATSGKVKEQEYKCYRLQGEGDTSNAIRVAVISIGNNQNMFVKMTGPSALVDAQSAAMDQLVSSLQW